MHKSPLVLGVDSKHLKDFGLPEKFEATGSNTGNIIFSEALFRCVGGAVRSDYMFKPKELEGRDSIVVTAANWVNPDSEFTALLKHLEATNLPIYTIGLGAQANNTRFVPKLKPDQERLIRLLADRCTTLSVRGAYSAQVMFDLGIKNVEVTGCPSLLLMGRGPKIRASRGPERVTLHGTRHWFDNGLPEQDAIYQKAIANNYDLVLQSELAEICVSTGTAEHAEHARRAENALRTLYPGRHINEVKEYLRKNAKVFFDLSEWVEYSKTRDLFVGTRIHGTIAALLGGTRAILLTHDARTEELAEALNVPHVPIDRFHSGHYSNLNTLYEMASPAKLEAGYKQYRATFKQFMKRNCLTLKSPGPLFRPAGVWPQIKYFAAKRAATFLTMTVAILGALESFTFAS